MSRVRRLQDLGIINLDEKKLHDISEAIQEKHLLIDDIFEEMLENEKKYDVN